MHSPRHPREGISDVLEPGSIIQVLTVVVLVENQEDLFFRLFNRCLLVLEDTIALDLDS